jgi:uncharacterized protein (DUF1499 family)
MTPGLRLERGHDSRVVLQRLHERRLSARDADQKLGEMLGGDDLHGVDVSIGAVFSWKRPTNLGVREGRLAPCKRTPNCVSSQANPTDPEHYIAPMHGSMAAARAALQSMPRTTLVVEKHDYLYAEVRSRLLGYVDDVELYFDGQVIHVRSCSRLGRRDFGVNRKRVEELRRLIEVRR